MNGSMLCPGYPGVERRRHPVLPYSGQERRSSISIGHGLDNADLYLPHAASGDTEAFARLFDHSVDKIFMYIYYVVGDRSVAEHLTAQVFLKAWRRLQQGPRVESSLLALLYRLTCDLAADYRRLQLGLEAKQRPDSIASGLAMENEYLAALNQLGDEQRRVLVLRFLVGYSTDQVAQILGAQPSAIQSIQSRGLDRLVRILGKGAEK